MCRCRGECGSYRLSDFIERWYAQQAIELPPPTPAATLALRTPVELAGRFVEVLRERLSLVDFELVVVGAVHPDDKLDGNMAMDEAFRRLHRRGSWMGSDLEEGRCTEAQAQADTDLWNAAYSLAIRQMVASPQAPAPSRVQQQSPLQPVATALVPPQRGG